MAELPESLLYEGIRINIFFAPERPNLGDLFLLCDIKSPKFPPSGKFKFDILADLQFDQIDDYFGIRALSEEGDDVVIWLCPLINEKPVYHHPGPFDGVSLSYSILRNPIRRAYHFLKCVAEIADFGCRTLYRNRDIEIGSPPHLSGVQADIDAVVSYWEAKGIEVGSDKALMIDL